MAHPGTAVQRGMRSFIIIVIDPLFQPLPEFAATSKGSSHIPHGLTLPVGDHVGVKLIAAGQFGNGLLTTNRLQGNPGFKFG